MGIFGVNLISGISGIYLCSFDKCKFNCDTTLHFYFEKYLQLKLL